MVSSMLLILLQTGCFVSVNRYRMTAEQLNDLTVKNKDLMQKYNNVIKEKEDLEERNTLLLSALDSKETTHSTVVGDLTKENGKLIEENKQLALENEDLKEKIVKISRQKKEEISTLKTTYNKLVDNMQGEIESGEIEINQLKGQLSVNIIDKILFESGEVEIKEAGLEVLKRLGNILKQVNDKQIRIEGHTDNVSIGKDLKTKYPTNWELSASRAINVAKYMQDKVGIDPGLLFVCAYAQYRPLADNKTKEGRAKNRRIEIVLVPLEEQITETEEK